MARTEIFVVAAARTAIGTFGGALKDVPLSQLATTAVRAALERSGADPRSIEANALASATSRLRRPRNRTRAHDQEQH